MNPGEPVPSPELGRAALTFGISGGEMGKRILAFDWSATSLGPIVRWPQSLRTVVSILLSSRYAMWMAWGPDLTFICNDAYRPTLGIKDPWALGARADRIWAEIWPDIGPRIQSVLTTGTATYDEGLLLFLERSGFPEETYHTFSYSPLANDEGLILGMLCVVTEETDRVIGARRVETLRHVGTALASTKTEEEVFEALKRQLSLNPKDLPFTLIYLFDAEGRASLAASSGISPGHPVAADRIEPESRFPWPAHEIFQDPATRLLRDLGPQGQLADLPLGGWNKPVEQVVLVPIKQQGQEQPAGLLVAGTNPYRSYDQDYSGFVELLAGQVASALANARAYEEERRRAQALAEIDRAKTTFFSNVSHELRTPLTLMLSPVEELLDQNKPEGSSTDLDLLQLVYRNGLRLQRLVNTLLDFSRLESGRVQAVYQSTDLPRYTAELAANFQSATAKAGLDFQVNCGEPLTAAIYVDLDMWEKIVLNLLSNALKFTFDGGISVAMRSTEGHAELTVRDTGTGIPEPELPNIFERFHRVAGAKGRTIEGTGIGLALVQELVKLHGGSIEVESQPDVGSVFTVRIPFGTAHLPKDKLQTAAGTAPTGVRSDYFVQESLRWLDESPAEDNGGISWRRRRSEPKNDESAERVLLADDNPDMREYIGRLLSDTYRVTTVSNGTDALKEALSDPPDLILSDIMMPGLSGFGLIKELRSYPETRTIPVVLVSARAGEESQVEGLDAGADDYLVKPFTARELLARVAAHLSMNRRRREAEEALTQSQAALQSFYDSSPFLMGIVEVEGDTIRPVYGNAATARFFQVDVETFPLQSSENLEIPRHVDDLWIANYLRSQLRGSFGPF